MSVDSDCIARLLASFEREEYEEIEWPTDVFARQLFVEVFFPKSKFVKLKIF